MPFSLSLFFISIFFKNKNEMIFMIYKNNIKPYTDI
jgi:hypothetical protein